MEKQAFMAHFSARLEEEKALIAGRIRNYAEKGCRDDAMLEKIRLNICDALGAAVKAGERQQGLEAALAFAEKRLRDIPAQWQRNLEAAIRYGDEKARAIEEIKMDLAARIQSILEECKGGEA